jgi:hypothetical protein
MIARKPGKSTAGRSWRSLVLGACLALLGAGCTGDDRAADAGADAEACRDQDQDWWCEGADCNDTDSAINPGQDEQPANDLDDDCDQLTDEAS